MKMHSKTHNVLQIGGIFCLTVALLPCAIGCSPTEPIARPQAAFSGPVFEEGKAAVSGKDPNAVLPSIAMQSFATSDKTPNWTYLYASQKYGKYYVVFNDGEKSTAGIYGDTRGNEDEWQHAADSSNQSINQVTYDADAAYKKVIDEYYDGASNAPYRMALITYDAENVRNADSPQLMAWYIYIASQEKYDELAEADSEQQRSSNALQENNNLGAITGEGHGSENNASYENAIEATYTVDAVTGEMRKL